MQICFTNARSPFSGKTYLGVQFVRALLANTLGDRLIGPLLVVCLTNHALDSFLVALLDVGITGIVRVGGRSQTSRLEPYNLRNLGEKVSACAAEDRPTGDSPTRHLACMVIISHLIIFAIIFLHQCWDLWHSITRSMSVFMLDFFQHRLVA